MVPTQEAGHPLTSGLVLAGKVEQGPRPADRPTSAPDLSAPSDHLSARPDGAFAAPFFHLNADAKSANFKPLPTDWASYHPCAQLLKRPEKIGGWSKTGALVGTGVLLGKYTDLVDDETTRSTRSHLFS